jgi:hypothetical protein
MGNLKQQILQVLLVVLYKTLWSSAGNVAVPEAKFFVGDPRNCDVDSTAHRMEVLPGIGWDNLQNLDMSQVLAVNYSQCKTTADKKYLLPDHTFVVPIKQSKVDLFSQLYDHWSDYKSSTSYSINAEASFFSVVSGSFSTDFQYNKERQVNDRSFTTRVEIRHLLYTIKSQPNAALSRPLINSLMEIAANIQNNKSDLAWYHTQILIRDFGTHYSTSVNAGASLVKEDHIKNTFLKETSKTSVDVKAAASASFFSKISLKFGAETKSSKEYLDQYTGNQTSSRIFTHGGPPFGANFTVNDWENGLINELVPINRDGNPLYYAINPSTLPGLPTPTVSHVSNMVKDAIKMYYKVNTLPGCTDSESPDFYLQANLDDGTCKKPSTNFTFGGVFQKCYSIHSGAGNLCDKLQQKNPITGDFTCPKGYREVLLIRPGGKRPSISSSYHKTQCYQSCHSCGFLWLSTCCSNRCENVLHYSQAEYDSYWCAAEGNHVPQHSGVLFGGVYTTTSSNPVTGSQKCPNRFYPRALGGHAFVCVSDDYELGYQNSLRFAGFFSCSAGNPLAIPNKKDPINGTQLRSFSGMEAFFASSNENGESFYGPRNCPNGYSQHLVTVDNQCEINYCIKAGSFKDGKLNPVKRLPFSPQPGTNPNSTEAVIIIGVNGQVWVKNLTTGDWEQKAYSDTEKSDQSFKSQKTMTNGVTAAISISVTTLVGILVVAIFIGFRKHRQMKRYHGNGLLDSYVGSERRPLTTSEDE